MTAEEIRALALAHADVKQRTMESPRLFARTVRNVAGGVCVVERYSTDGRARVSVATYGSRFVYVHSNGINLPPADARAFATDVLRCALAAGRYGG